MTSRRRSVVETPTTGEGPLLGPLTRQAARWFEEGVVAGLAARGIDRLSFTQIDLVIKLDTEGITIAELARRAGVARQSAHQAVGELVKAGMVRVDPNPDSARSKLVRPTSLGLTRLKIARDLLQNLEHQLAERIGDERLEQLRIGLDRDWSDRPEIP